MSFDQFDLPSRLIDALAKLSIANPTPVLVFSYVYRLSLQADSGDQGFGCFGIGEVADGDSDKAAAGVYREMKPAWWK
jgi:hypothetical protein